MADVLDPHHEARRIVNTYLSKLNGVRQFRQTLNRAIYPGFQRETLEAKERQGDQLAAEAENYFNDEVKQYLNEQTQSSKEILAEILRLLKNRSDLGFFARRLVARLARLS